MSALLLLGPIPLPEGLGIPPQDWQQTPTSVRCQFLSLLKRVDALEARFNQNSSNSSRPPSTDSPSTKRQRRTKAAERRKPGAKLGHPGHHQVRLKPTASVPCCPMLVLVAIVDLRKSPCLTRIRSLNYPSFALK